MPGGRLSWQDRQQIAAGLADGKPYTEIAKRLGRPTSTVSREVQRNGGPESYTAEPAHQAAGRRAKRGRTESAGGAGAAGEVGYGFEERFAEMMVHSGLPRMIARVLACLITSETGILSAAELVQRLRVSPASVSKAVSYLETLDLVCRERDARRRERYLFDDDVWYRAVSTQMRVCELWADAGREGAEVYGADTPAGARLHEMSQFFTFVGRDMAQAAEHWRDVFRKRRTS